MAASATFGHNLPTTTTGSPRNFSAVEMPVRVIHLGGRRADAPLRRRWLNGPEEAPLACSTSAAIDAYGRYHRQGWTRGSRSRYLPIYMWQRGPPMAAADAASSSHASELGSRAWVMIASDFGVDRPDPDAARVTARTLCCARPPSRSAVCVRGDVVPLYLRARAHERGPPRLSTVGPQRLHREKHRAKWASPTVRARRRGRNSRPSSAASAWRGPGGASRNAEECWRHVAIGGGVHGERLRARGCFFPRRRRSGWRRSSLLRTLIVSAVEAPASAAPTTATGDTLRPMEPPLPRRARAAAPPPAAPSDAQMGTGTTCQRASGRAAFGKGAALRRCGRAWRALLFCWRSTPSWRPSGSRMIACARPTPRSAQPLHGVRAYLYA